MNVRSLLLLVALAAVGVTGAWHWHAMRTRSRLEADHARVLADVAEQRRLHDEDARRLVAARHALQALLTERANRPAAVVASSLDASPASGPPSPSAKSSATPPNPELRRLHVQAFVSEQRLRFAALLERLGFTSEKLQAFDRIQGACQDVMLDGSQTDAARQQARQVRDAQLAELFGVNYEQWLDAHRNEPARAIVNQIVQQTFQSSGALTTAQADELTRIVAQHRVVPSRDMGAGSSRYDWDQIITDAQSILAERQREDFVAAIEFRRASDKMSAMAAKKKS